MTTRTTRTTCTSGETTSHYRHFEFEWSHDEGESLANVRLVRVLQLVKLHLIIAFEFQRVHRLGKKTDGSTRPIIARFLRFPDREPIFQKAMELKNKSDVKVKVYTDFPKEIQDRRKKQWPKLKRAREDGKTAFFSKQEPDKLFIDGIFVPFP